MNTIWMQLVCMDCHNLVVSLPCPQEDTGKLRI